MFCSKLLVFIFLCLTVSHLQGLDPFACLQRDVKGGAAILSYNQQTWVHRILGKLIVFCFNPKIAPFLAPAKYFRYRDRKIMKNLVYTPIAPRYQFQLKKKTKHSHLSSSASSPITPRSVPKTSSRSSRLDNKNSNKHQTPYESNNKLAGTQTSTVYRHHLPKLHFPIFPAHTCVRSTCSKNIRELHALRLARTTWLASQAYHNPNSWLQTT